jgi:hypothetical protein
MNSGNISFPFRTTTDSIFGQINWSYTIEENQNFIVTESNKTVVKDWNYNSTIYLSREIEVDYETVIKDCKIPDGTRFNIVTSWFCPNTKTKELININPIQNSEDSSVTLNFEISSEKLSGYFYLDIELVLAVDIPSIDFTASKKTQKLSQTRHQFLLEGNGGQFPTYEVDFGHFDARDACWHLDLDSSDLHSNILNCARLYLNIDKQQFIKDATNSSSLISNIIYWNTAKNIIEAVLENDSYFEDSGNYPENSFGSIADTLVRICFPATPLESIRNLYREDRNKFSTKILGTFETYYE